MEGDCVGKPHLNLQGRFVNSLPSVITSLGFLFLLLYLELL
jgi:hypothetical protein